MLLPVNRLTVTDCNAHAKSRISFGWSHARFIVFRRRQLVRNYWEGCTKKSDDSSVIAEDCITTKDDELLQDVGQQVDEEGGGARVQGGDQHQHQHNAQQTG